MYAVIQTGGKQYQVSVGDEIFVESLGLSPEDEVTFGEVVAVSTDEKGFVAGAPYVEGAKVTGKVIKNGKSKKITVFTYKSKKNEHRKLGHRQPYTKVSIQAIEA